MTWRSGNAFLLFWCMTGCASRETASLVSSVADSSGVQVVTISRLPDLDDPNYIWSTAVSRAIAIDRGLTESPLIYRPEALLRLPDRTIVVDDRADYRIVVLDAEEDTVRYRFARSGRGPGEIWGYAGIWPGSDGTLNVMDHGTGRYSVFTQEGRLISEHLVQIRGMGGLSVRTGSGMAFTSRYYTSEDPDVFLIDSLGIVDLDKGTFQAIMPLWRPRNLPDGTPSAAVIFAPRVLWAALGDGVVVGRSDREDFKVFSDQGTLERVIHIPLTPREVTEEDKAEIFQIAAGLPGAPGLERRVNPTFNVTNDYYTFDDTSVAMYHSRTTRGAEDVAVPDSQTVWRVFAKSGRYRGAIWFPKHFYPRWVGGNRVLGTTADSTGAEIIEELQLTPPVRDKPARE